MHRVEILLTEPITHNVKRFILEKPNNYKFTPGQATDIAIDLEGWRDNFHPFTFTSLNEDKVLEFVIKGYDPEKSPGHEGMTQKLHTLTPGQNLIIGKPFGTIKYQGKGVFIAGGAGITPFIAIFKDLYKDKKIKGHKLIFSNKTTADIILQKELETFFAPEDLTFILTQQKNNLFTYGRIDKNFLTKTLTNFSQNFYICGPSKMVKNLTSILSSLGASTDSVIFEK